jgi:hypothetical protein
VGGRWRRTISAFDNTYSYSYLSFGGYIRGKALMDGYWNRVAERNAPDTSPYRAGFAQFVCVADTDADAKRLYAQPFDSRISIDSCQPCKRFKSLKRWPAGLG